MKILVVTTRSYSDLHGGDSQRIYHVCRYLSQVCNYNLDIMTLTGTEVCAEFEYLADKIFEIKGNPVTNLFRNLFSVLFRDAPITSAIYQNKKYNKILSTIITDYDLVIFHLVRSFPLSLPNYNGKIIVEATDLISKNYRNFFEMSVLKKMSNLKSMVFSFDYRRYEKLETKIVDTVNRFVLVNDSDLDDSFRLKSNVRILPNGRTKMADKNELSVKPDQPPRPRALLFIGNLKSEQNWLGLEDFYHHCFSKNQLRDVDLIIAGNIPKNRRRILETWQRVKVRPNYSKIDDLYKTASIGIAPISIGAGLQNKILDYAELGLPIITTSLAASAFDFSDQMYVSDNFDEWQSLILSVLNGSSVRYVSKESLEKYDWDNTLKGYAE